MVFLKRAMDQANEQQRHFNEWPNSELLGEVDSIQTSLKLVYPPTIMTCRLCLSPQDKVDGISRKFLSRRKFFLNCLIIYVISLIP